MFIELTNIVGEIPTLVSIDKIICIAATEDKVTRILLLDAQPLHVKESYEVIAGHLEKLGQIEKMPDYKRK